MAVPPVGSQQTSAVAAKVQEPKKKASKKKTEPGKQICFRDLIYHFAARTKHFVCKIIYLILNF